MLLLSVLIPLISFLLMGSLLVSFSGYIALATERQNKIRITNKLIATYARETCIHALFSAVNPLGRFLDPSCRGFQSDQNAKSPLVIVGDLGWRSINLYFLRSYLRQRGWETIICVSLGDGDQPLSEHAERLAQVAKTLIDETQATRIDIIGHGVGGLVAAWYSQHLDKEGYTHRLITMGTAWQGSRTAILSRNRLGEQLIYKAPILDNLKPGTPHVSCIWGKDDPTIVPNTSASPIFDCQCVEIEAAGHMELLTSARAFRGVRTCLEASLQVARGHD